jgi:hypothetical protein
MGGRIRRIPRSIHAKHKAMQRRFRQSGGINSCLLQHISYQAKHTIAENYCRLWLPLTIHPARQAKRIGGLHFWRQQGVWYILIADRTQEAGNSQ